MSREGHVDEFVRLFTIHEPRLHAYVLSMVPNWADAEEVLQDSNTILWKKFGEFEPESNFFAWACQIARNEVMHYRRRKGRERVRFDDEFIDRVAEESVRIDDELREQQAELIACLDKLPLGDRDLIARRYEQGASTAEVARQVDRSVDGIYKSLARIRGSLLECVQRAESRRNDS